MAFSAGAVTAELNMDDAGFQRGVAGGLSSLGRLSSSFIGIGKTAAIAVAAITAAGVGIATSLGKSAIQGAADLEQQQIAFTTLLGSAQEADEAISAIVEDAKKTPYELPGLIKANQLLVSAGVGAEQARKDVMNLGNAISATGGTQVELDRVVQNLQQIRNVGQASAVDIKQFGFAGINIIGLLADSMGKTKAEISGMVTEGKIGYTEITAALGKASEEGGKYFGALERQSTSFNGILSNIKDTWRLTLVEIAKSSGFFDAVKNAANSLLTVLTDNKDTIAAVATTIIQKIGSALQFIGAAFQTVFQDYIIPVLAEAKRQWMEQQGPIGKIRSAVEWMANTVASAFSTISSWLQEAKRQWQEQQGPIGFVRKQYEAIKEQIVTQLVPAVKDMMNSFNENKDELRELAGIAAKVAKVAFVVLVIAIRIAVQIMVALATRTAQLITIMNKLGNAVQGIRDSFVSRWAEIKVAVLTTAADIIQAVVNLGTKIVSVFTEIDLYEIGKDVILGFINGIKGMAGEVANAAREVAASAENAIKGALHIESPSKVFHKIGAFTVDGFVDGIASKIERAKASGALIARTLSDEAKEKLETELGDVGSMFSELQSKTADYFQDFRNQIKSAKDSWKDLKSSIKSSIADIKEITASANVEIANLQTSLSSDIAKALIEAEDNVKSLQKELDAKKNDSTYNSNVSSTKSDATTEIARLKGLMNEHTTAAEIAEIQKRIANVKSERDAKLAELKSQHDEELAEIQSKLNTEKKLINNNKSAYTEFFAAIKKERSYNSLDAIGQLRYQFNQEKTAVLNNRDAQIKEAYAAFKEQHGIRVQSITDIQNFLNKEEDAHDKTLKKIKRRRKLFMGQLLSDVREATAQLNSLTGGALVAVAGSGNAKVGKTKQLTTQGMQKVGGITIGNITLNNSASIDELMQRLGLLTKAK